MEYTKGDWYVERNKTWVYASATTVPVFIADCGRHGNAEANAKLIASAPNSHEANKVALALVNALIEQQADLANDYRVQMVKTTLEQAIAKAKGS